MTAAVTQESDVVHKNAVELWTPICAIGDLTADRGVGAFVRGCAVAVFRCSPHGSVYAIGNIDPFCGAAVLSRGIVGSVLVDGDTVVFVASPRRKHRFDLRSGVSLDDHAVSAGSWSTRLRGDIVDVGGLDDIASCR